MANYTITSWQGIPSMVEAKVGRKRHKVQLSSRFQELIDRVAMRQKLVGTDEYLELWQKGSVQQREGEPEQVAKEIAEELEARFDVIRAEAIASVQPQ